MNELVLMFGIHSDSTLIELIPLFGMLTGIIIPIATVSYTHLTLPTILLV